MTTIPAGDAPTTETPSTVLEDRYEAESGTVHLSGMQALVRLPLEQRQRDRARGLDTGILISGYEGSPLAGYDLQLMRQSERLEAERIVFSPSVNEELAATSVQGSQLANISPDLVGDGVVGIWYGKAPGLDRASDALRHGNLGGAAPNGGVLALVGDDSIAKSSTVPSSSEVAIAELGFPCLSPADPEDILRLGLHGIAMSRASGLWVALKLATNVVDGSDTVHLDRLPRDHVEPDRTFDGVEFTHTVTAELLQPRLGQLEATQVRERLEMARRYAAANRLDDISGDPAATLGIICAGSVYRDVRQALRDIGISDDELHSCGVKILKLGMIHPLEPTVVTRFAEGLTDIVVVEEKRAFIELAVKDLLYGRAGAPRVLGKRDAEGGELFRADADLPAHYIATRLAPLIRDHDGAAAASAWLDAQATVRRTPKMLPILPRTPYFCSGCPHNRSTRVPDGALVGGGIGCHALVMLQPEDRVGDVVGLSAMGSEGAAWIGMSPFVSRAHLFQNLGDGTYHHSGSLAIRAAIASKANITYKLLYNDTVAMTGGQDPVGKMSVPSIAASLLAEGVREVVVTSDDPRAARKQFGARMPRSVTIAHRDELIAVQERLAAVPGVTVLIHQQECATELRRKRKRGIVAAPKQRILINERVCEGCGDCGEKSNCLSVQPVDTPFGRKTQIHQASCNLDFSCVQGDCPSFVEVVPETKKARPARQAKAEAALPAPPRLVEARDFAMRITGVGGTGIVTVAQVLAAAAGRSGLQVSGLDQLGLAQKGGAVVSDLRFALDGASGSNKLGPGGCDLFLACDILVAAADANLDVIDPERTYTVASTSVTPTGAMVTDTRVRFPEMQTLIDRIQWGGARPENVFVDAREAVGGNDQFANIFLLGVAVQSGVLPLDPEDIEWALDLNGVQVERNIAAFRDGRRYVADGRPTRRARRATPTAAVDIDRFTSAEGELRALVSMRADELVRYQGHRYAERYIREVERVRAREAAALGATDISEIYAQNLFKVMAYKDEYEVARLQVDPAFEAQVRDEFGDGARYSYLLHPPVLRALGMKNKIRLNAWWARPFMRTLAALRPLRGTPLDMFGYARVRRAERALIGDYIDAVTRATERLDPQRAALAGELAALPDLVRGYEDIKLRALDEYESRKTHILDALA